jgi:DNA polymerase I-like protein with 3'-5' exonuclease and polymerase domains
MPTKEETKTGGALGGNQGQLIDDTLSRFKIPQNKIYRTNAMLCNPGGRVNKKEIRKARECCRPRLWNELKGYRYILTFGDGPFQTLVGKALVDPWVGSIYDVKTKLYHHRLLKNRRYIIRHKVLACFRPGMVYGNRALLPVFHIFINRAWKMATGKLPLWRRPHMIIKPGRAMVAAMEAMVNANLPVSVDIETIGTDPLTCKISAISLANRNVSISMPWDGYEAGKFGSVRGLKQYKTSLYTQIIALAQRILSEKRIIAQNGQHDVLGLKPLGFTNINYVEDTLYKHATVAPQLPHDLGFMCAIEHHGSRWKSIFGELKDSKGKKEWVKRDPYALRDYNAEDSWRTVILDEALDVRLDDKHRGRELYQQYMDLAIKAAIPMRERGILTDPVARETHRKPVAEAANEALRKLKALAAEYGLADFNPNSGPQKHALFFQKFQVPVTARTDTGAPSLNAATLRKIISGTHYHAACAAKLMLEYSAQNKILATYINGLEVDLDNIIHPSWRVDGARTGRWSSAEPNMQNIPKNLRDIIIARPDHYIVSADYSQLELVILATLAGASKMLSWIDEGLDLHSMTAAELWGINVKNVTKPQRTISKTINYAVAYRADDQTIWQSIIKEFPDTPYRLVPKIHEKWNMVHWEIPKYQYNLCNLARENGYTEIPLSGRRYHHYGQYEDTKIVNTPIQGTAADLINRATLRIVNELDWGEDGLLMQVHDELNLESKDWQKAAGLLKEEMGAEVVFPNGEKRKFAVDVSLGHDWGNLRDVMI